LKTKILVAEDEPALREIFCEVVESLGFDCIAASDGREALELAREHKPHIIITDYMMPERNGADLIRAVREDEALKRVPVILLSAGRPPESARKEAWLFLPKPLDVEQLEKALRDALTEAEARGPATAFTSQVDASVSPVLLAREEMLGWVSHEIKSPLSAAMSANQLAMRGLRNGEDTSATERRLLVIMRQLYRMDELVNSLLDAAQLQEGKLEFEKEHVDVAELAQTVVTFWKESHAETIFEVSTATADAPFVLASRERLRQIVDNLVSNAVKYGHGGAAAREPIVVSLTTTETDVVVRVTDRGRGIAPDQVPHIFDRFHRVAGQGGHGHGLGLYIAAALTRLHGGAITVDSELGRGSTFAVTLPRTRAASST
jgi:two-component system sensor histidine kinase/response regulator